jgi:predicted enzyme involved in methoxymalonyl-ACP biosynthesis
MHLSRQILSRFPDDIDVIRRECAGSEPFRTLCADHAVCARALRRWQNSDQEESRALADEYEQWLGELELEIQEWLDRLRETA